MELDPRRFPRAAEFVEKLSHGLSSHPECRLKADIHEEISQEFPALVNAGGIPKTIEDYLRGNYKDKWLPEVCGNCLILMVRDACFSSDEDYLDWCCEYMGRLFQKPLYKIMMNVFSTSLIVMGAAKRWATFHQGSDLRAEPIKKVEGRYQSVGSLTYPPHLFTGLIVPQLGSVYTAALKANKAEEPKVISKETSKTESMFFVSWKA